MNCDNDFYIPFKRTYIKVKPFCESADVHYKVYLSDQEIKLHPAMGEGGLVHWTEYDKGETELAKELGSLIDEQQK